MNGWFCLAMLLMGGGMVLGAGGCGDRLQEFSLDERERTRVVFEGEGRWSSFWVSVQTHQNLCWVLGLPENLSGQPRESLLAEKHFEAFVNIPRRVQNFLIPRKEKYFAFSFKEESFQKEVESGPDSAEKNQPMHWSYLQALFDASGALVWAQSDPQTIRTCSPSWIWLIGVREVWEGLPVSFRERENRGPGWVSHLFVKGETSHGKMNQFSLALFWGVLEAEGASEG